jgi:putative nucleotidyltransferase with HDIG domain
MLLAYVSELMPVRLPRGAHVSVASGVFCTIAIIFGPAWTALAAALVNLAAEATQRRPWYKLVFNTAGMAFWWGFPALLYASIVEPGSDPLQPASLSAFGVMASANILLNVLMVSAVISLYTGHRMTDIISSNFRGVLLQYLATLPLGILTSVAYLQNGPISASLLILPLMAVYYALRTTQDIRDQTTRTIELLADSVDRRDPYTYRHSQMVAEYAEMIARKLELPLDEVDTIVSAARVHDLGKIGVPDAILQKPGKLTPDEFEIMKQHVTIGAEIVSRLPQYRKARELILCHQEYWDGSGYPFAKRGEDIPLGARIIAVADAYQAMTSDRVYRKALPHDVAVKILREGAGKKWDPRLVEIFIQAIEERRLQEHRTAEPSMAGREVMGQAKG